MIKITINVPWGHGDSPHKRVVSSLESLLEKITEVRESHKTADPKSFELESKLSVGSYKVEFGSD